MDQKKNHDDIRHSLIPIMEYEEIEMYFKNGVIGLFFV